jgi:Outer membrane protein beta-barrel family/CarboxypepD_reg-like domain
MQVKFLYKKISSFVLLMIVVNYANSQNITLKGIVTDKSDKSAITGATVTLINQKDTALKTFKLTDANGNFQFNKLSTNAYVVKISYSGYEKIEQKINLQASNKVAIPFAIAKIATDLKGVVIVAKAQPVRQKGDTTEFSASQFKVNPDATAEDIIKKLPGITVARDGTVTAAGEQVRKVTVDGKDFFGDDATAALRNLPADVIDKIQVFDRLSDQAQLTGFDDGNSIKTVNIVTKSGIRNGQFGRIYAGAGTNETYAAGGNVSLFKGDRRLSFVGNFNNINLQNFSSQDLLGVTSSGGGGGNRGGGNRGGGGGTDNFTVGQSNGINQTNAFGVNFSNVYNKKLTLTGSYFFNQSKNESIGESNRETFNNPKNIFTHQESNTVSTNYNHRINLRLEYKIDSSNSLFIIPNISFQKNNSIINTLSENFYGINDSTNNSIGLTASDRSGYNIRNSILFRHSFPKRGRSLSVGINTTWSKNNGTSITDTDFRLFKSGIGIDSLFNRFTDNATNGTNIGANIAFTEPIGKKGQLQIDYTPSVQKNKANQQAFGFDGGKYSIFDTTLSNKFDNTIITNNAGVSYRLGQSRDEQLSFGLNFQHSTLQSDRAFPTTINVNQSFSNILPNVSWRKKISNYSNIRLFYRASTNFPTVTQLQDVLNLANPIRVSIGNPDLKQSFTNFFNGRYTYTNTKTQHSFFANLFLQTASDYITSGTTILRKDTTIQKSVIIAGSQLSKPVNVDGYKNIRTLFTYSLPIKKLKTTVNLSAGYNYTLFPGLVNNALTKTVSNVYNTGVVLASNINEYVDFNLSYNANFNNSTTNTQNTTTTKFTNQVIGAQLNLLNKKGWFVQNDISGNVYSGLGAAFNQRFWLWNAGIGKKILKKQAGELKLSVFDLLKQNQSIIRTVNNEFIEDAQTNVLQQYFMLTFTYKLKNFGTPKTNQFNREGGDRQFRPGGMGGGAPNF